MLHTPHKARTLAILNGSGSGLVAVLNPGKGGGVTNLHEPVLLLPETVTSYPHIDVHTRNTLVDVTDILSVSAPPPPQHRNPPMKNHQTPRTVPAPPGQTPPSTQPRNAEHEAPRTNLTGRCATESTACGRQVPTDGMRFVGHYDHCASRRGTTPEGLPLVA